MEQLLKMLVVVVSPEQVLRRHYFLEVLNKPEYIWGIRALGLMTAILAFFLYMKLKEAENAVEAAVGGMAAAVDGTHGIAADSPSSDGVETLDFPILDLDLEPEPDQELEVTSEPEPDQELELSSEPTPAFDSDHISNQEPIPADISVTEHTYKQRDKIKPVRRHIASNVAEITCEKNLWLLALLGISLGGLILYTYGRKRKKGKR